jgi:two-component system sensor histidine kinase/response regulator
VSEQGFYDTAPKRTILVADDEKHIAEAIAITLDQEGLETTVTHDGDQALAMAYVLQPDLILLDVMMPGRSGVEVCATLKSDPSTASIPVVLITAKTQPQDRIAGFAAGADEYLTKPFSPTELIALVSRLLAGGPIEPRPRDLLQPVKPVDPPNLATMAADQLVVYARELRELVEREQSQRKALEQAHQRLGELDRLKAAFLSVVTHELLTPFGGIGLPLQVLQRNSEDLAPGQHDALEELATEIAGLHQMVRGVVKFAELMNKRREPQPGYYALDLVIPAAVQPVAVLAQSRQVDFRCMIPYGIPKVHADPELLGEAVFQMAHNAVKFNVPGGQAEVRGFQSGEWVVIEVSDTGVGLTPERLALLGQPFEQSADALRRGREGLGIGWAFVCYVAEVHAGQTHVESRGPGQGSTFALALPRASAEPTPLAGAGP